MRSSGAELDLFAADARLRWPAIRTTGSYFIRALPVAGFGRPPTGAFRGRRYPMEFSRRDPSERLPYPCQIPIRFMLEWAKLACGLIFLMAMGFTNRPTAERRGRT